MLMDPANTVRPVNARWLRIVDVHRTGKPAKRKNDDDWIPRGLQHLQRWEKCANLCQHEQLTLEMPDLDAACRLRFDEDRLARARLEGQLLAGRTVEEAAATCGLLAEGVQAYEAIHYQVFGRLNASAFIFTEAIGMSVLHPLLDERDQDILLKLVGYQRGSEFSEAAYRFFRGGVQVPERLEEATAAHLEELAALLRVRAFIATRVAPRRGSPHAGRIIEVTKSLERYVARRRLQPDRSKDDQAGGDLGQGLAAQARADVPAQDKLPRWWPALRIILQQAA